MKIVTLLENTAVNDEYKSKHGLCFYIETRHHKILIDVGPDEAFLENAKILGINISEVDTLIISHAHDDHGGGLQCFIDANKNAKIYIRKTAFDNYYANENNNLEYVGLNKSLKNNDRIMLTDVECEIDDEIFLFSNITGRRFFSTANSTLMKETNGVIENDDFTHEQCVVIKDDEKLVLLGGCAHNGIVNILDKFEIMYGKDPDYVISGFHLYNPATFVTEKSELIDDISNELCKHKTKFYTCHCTGHKAYKQLKKNLNKQIDYLSTGSVLNI